MTAEVTTGYPQTPRGWRPPVTRYGCGHVGRMSISREGETKAFIRVAEIRGATINPGGNRCPDCSRRYNGET